MDTTEAYQILKECIELDENTQEAYDTVIANQDEYRIVIDQMYNEIKISIEMGQSLVVAGEMSRQFYNGTHRLINGEIIDLPGSELCKEIGKVAYTLIEGIAEINTMSEEYAKSQISCYNTIDVSYM